MQAYYPSIDIEQSAKSILRASHNLVFKADFQADGLVRLIDDDFVLFVRHGVSVIGDSNLCENLLRKDFQSVVDHISPQEILF